MNPERWRLPHRLLAAAVSGGLLLLAFPPFDQAWLAVVALVPVLLALRGARGRAGFAVGAVFGGVFFGGLLWWISLFGFLALAVMTAAHAAYTGAFGALAARGERLLGGLTRVVGWPLLWAGLEMMRARWPLSGLTWGDVGYAQIDGPMVPLARLGGLYVLGAVIVAVNALLAEVVVAPQRWGSAGVALVLAIGPIALPLGADGDPAAGTLDLAAVQGNVPRDLFRGFGRTGRVGPEDAVIIDNHLQVTERLLGGPSPDLIVWPENAFDRDPRLHPSLFEPVRALTGRIGSPIILPAILDAGEGFTNSNLLVDVSGEVVERYDKVHLVPFGEYVPWDFARDLVPALAVEIPHDGVAGDRLVPFDVGDTRVGTLICFESIYPRFARSLVRMGSNLIVITTNNASYQDSPASEQYLAMTRMRAVEHGRSVVFAAISGISAIIEPDGTIQQRSGLFEQALLRGSLPILDGQTPYTRYGSFIEIVVGMGALAAALAGIVRRRTGVPG